MNPNRAPALPVTPAAHEAAVSSSRDLQITLITLHISAAAFPRLPTVNRNKKGLWSHPPKKASRASWRDQSRHSFASAAVFAREEAATENRHGPKSRTQAARTDHHRRLRDHQHRSACAAIDRRRQHSYTARVAHLYAGNRCYAGQAGLSGGAVDVYFAGPAGQSRHLLQPGARYRHRGAERVADHRRHQQPYFERRSLSRPERSQKARRLREEASRSQRSSPGQAQRRHGRAAFRLSGSATSPAAATARSRARGRRHKPSAALQTPAPPISVHRHRRGGWGGW